MIPVQPECTLHTQDDPKKLNKTNAFVFTHDTALSETPHTNTETNNSEHETHKLAHVHAQTRKHQITCWIIARMSPTCTRQPANMQKRARQTSRKRDMHESVEYRDKSVGQTET